MGGMPIDWDKVTDSKRSSFPNLFNLFLNIWSIGIEGRLGPEFTPTNLEMALSKMSQYRIIF